MDWYRLKGYILVDHAWLTCIKYNPTEYPGDSEYEVHFCQGPKLFVNNELKQKIVEDLGLHQNDEKCWINQRALAQKSNSHLIKVAGQDVDLSNLRAIVSGPTLGQTMFYDCCLDPIVELNIDETVMILDRLLAA